MICRRSKIESTDTAVGIVGAFLQVIDFGFAKRVQPATVALAEQFVPNGGHTKVYMPPEVGS
jgi:hypothetical protein